MVIPRSVKEHYSVEQTHDVTDTQGEALLLQSHAAAISMGPRRIADKIVVLRHYHPTESDPLSNNKADSTHTVTP